MSAVGIIPARWGASRFPGKPLVEIAGVPMVLRVAEGARSAKRLRDVIVATDDARIARVCEDAGVPVAMTASDHPTGTDRLAEVAATLDDDLIVNIQGDEPTIVGDVVDNAVEALERAPAEIPMATIVHVAEAEALEDPNRVKVVLDRAGDALYFSRSAIPHLRDGGAPSAVHQHVGLYVYRREFLARFVALPPSPLERAEALEQLRALENGARIRCAVIEGWKSAPVDTPEDVARAEAALAGRTVG